MAEKDVNADLSNSTAGAAPVDPNQKQPSRPSSAKQGKENAVTQKDREERLRQLKERQNEDRQRKLEELKQQALAAQKFREQKEEERRRRMEEMRSRDTDRRHQVEERKRQIWEAEKDRREAILRKNQEREARIESKKKNERSSIVFAFGSSTPRMLEPADTGGSSYWATRRATSTSNVMMLSMTAPPGPLTRRSSERELDGSKKRATSAGGINRNKGEGDESDGGPTNNMSAAAAMAAARAAARRKTDLMPTIPSPRDRDLTPSRPQSSRNMRSPGRAYSMSRLDVLARPRKRTLQPPTPANPDPNLSRSMISLAHQQPSSSSSSSSTLRRADTSRSMLQLNAHPIAPPRPTRAERLRRKAREAAAGRSQSLEQTSVSPGMRSGEATPSRPTSAMSQHSVSSSIGMSTSFTSGNIRTRPIAAPRRTRPYSIAITGISSSTPSSDSPRQSLSSEHRASIGKSSSSSSGIDRPPLPKVHTTKKPLAAKPDAASKKQTDKVKSAKGSSASTPKATPLQSPGVEVVPLVHGNETSNVTTMTTVNKDGNETLTETVTISVSDTSSSHTEMVVTSVENVVVVNGAIDKHNHHSQVAVDKQPKKQDNDVATAQAPSSQMQLSHIDVNSDLPESDMTASMIARTRITTEEEAKAALAERRRLAREQAERDAELERQRLEAERLAEEERLRQEEEEQKRAEEDQLRLVEEARRAEELRLQQAIEEAQRREEEERKRKEEEEKQRKEKEEADKKAKEEAEKLRQEMEIKLKKEEEDRQARRKRVEAIMLRTRGKGATPPTSTPTKEDSEDHDVSPPSELNNKSMSVQEEFLHSERNHSAAMTMPDPAIQQQQQPLSPVSSNNPFLESSISLQKQNGHSNGVDNDSVEKNNITNNLLDFTSLETNNANNLANNLTSMQQPPAIVGGDILQPIPSDNLAITSTNGKLANDDNLNFNSQPFIAFQDNKNNTTVNDLLS